MKKILGLDLGTNSIGWALINRGEEEDAVINSGIEMLGSRILPMDAARIGDFGKGNPVSQTADRTAFRGIRRLHERQLLRRQRLLRVLHVMGWLPAHFEGAIDFDLHPGQFKEGAEPKLAWRKGGDGSYEFLFKDSFDEMLADFADCQPNLVAGGRKVPYDWTIYYLRKKALTQKISEEELAWLLLHFNQKRGYYQLRGEEEEERADKLVEFYELKVVGVEATAQKKGNDTWYNVRLENGMVYRRPSREPLDVWVGKTRQFIVTTDLNADGSPKVDKETGEVKRSFRAPKEDDWTLVKKRTENDLELSGKTVGAFIYDSLLHLPSRKIIGGLVRTIERKYYKAELMQILRKQSEFHASLRNCELLDQCLNELYPNNEAHKADIRKRGFVHLLAEDVIFYQRPLKSKKHLISDCAFEYNEYVDKHTGEVKRSPIKCAPKSHPLFQEFRLWQFLANLRILQREVRDGDVLRTDVDVTSQFLKNEDEWVALFDYLNGLDSINQKKFLKYPPFQLKRNEGDYRWNYMEDKDYPCNETRAEILGRLQKAGIDGSFLSDCVLADLWHILYSVTDKGEVEKALRTFAGKHGLGEAFVDALKKMKPFGADYAAFSLKALKRLLPLMRRGRYWSEQAIDGRTLQRIHHLVNGEDDEEIGSRVREKTATLAAVDMFRGLDTATASYVVYNRHSEMESASKWNSPDDVDVFLRNFRQHSLRNPIVEQVVTETLRVVRDVWRECGSISEIHVEMGREMKNPADKRKRMSEQIAANEAANLRIKTLLTEFLNPEFGVENVRPFSPSQQEIMRIYEDTVLSANQPDEEVEKILKKFKDNKQPSHAECLRYKLWLDQKYKSPYTGRHIPLGKLFTPAYEIEHVIPQSRYFDDSLSNKVICESAVNKLKNNQLGLEFIRNHHGEKVVLENGQFAEILSEKEYTALVGDVYGANKVKKNKLLMDEVPDGFIMRQLNDSRYISRYIISLLSNIVREQDGMGALEAEAVSKNVIVCNGSITDRLKKDWGMNDVWNDIVCPRFERLNTLGQNSAFGCWVNREGKRFFQTQVPLELQKGFSKKRIDHRHHAMDALVIACATRNHVNFLNNSSACSGAKTARKDLQHLLCEKVFNSDKSYQWRFFKPWNSFTQDAKFALQELVVSIKQNTRVINKTSNIYQRYGADGAKVLAKQTSGDSWAIRKPLHKDTVFGLVNLRKVKAVKFSVALDAPHNIVDKAVKAKVLYLQHLGYDKKRIDKYFKENSQLFLDLDPKKVLVYYFTNSTSEPLVAVRKSLDTSFDEKKIREAVTDTGIQKILLNHLAANGGNPDAAFSPEGVAQMNENLFELNGRREHKPIYKVRVCEPQGLKFPVGSYGNKASKFVEAAKGTNLFFGVYSGEEGKRVYVTVPFNEVVERLKQGLAPVKEVDEEGNRLLFSLSPNDLVYVPTADECENGVLNGDVDKSRIYKFVSSSGTNAFFVPVSVASPIVSPAELGSNNKAERAWTGEMIKAVCCPVKVDRLGRITKILIPK